MKIRQRHLLFWHLVLNLIKRGVRHCHSEVPYSFLLFIIITKGIHLDLDLDLDLDTGIVPGQIPAGKPPPGFNTSSRATLGHLGQWGAPTSAHVDGHRHA